MRSPEILGGLAALLVGTVMIAVVLAGIGAASVEAPTAGVPSVPVIPTAAPRATPSATPAQSPTPTLPVASGGVDSSAPPPREGVGIGELALAVELPLLDGRLLDTAEFEGRPLWINFMATWCPDCQDELPMMESFQA